MTPIVFIDTETTGFQPRKHEIIEIAAILIEPATGRTVDQAKVKVWPEHPERMHPKALAVNGYDPEVWKDAGGTFAAAWSIISPLLRGAQPAGHHIHFDLGFIQYAVARAALDPPAFANHWPIDTCAMARRRLGKRIKSKSLASCCDYFGISNRGAHSALADARRSLEVFRRMMNLPSGG